LSLHSDGGEAILHAFHQVGIDYIISSPGSEWAPVWEALARRQLNKNTGPAYIDCWHETLAVGMAIGYTSITQRPQAVLLHAGAGLLQSTVGIHAAHIGEVPMVVLSGEALTYGERPGVDPGSQWYRNLSIVGGPHRLVEPIVKWANQVTSPETLYESIVRAWEMSQRPQKGPVYLNVPLETMLADWTPPTGDRRVPLPPRTQPSSADIEAVADLMRSAQNPIILTESVGRSVEGFNALRELAELCAIPVFESRASVNANFPKDHALHAGFNIEPHLDGVDVALLVNCRAPWYPPSKRPPHAAIVAIADNPLKEHMVYQSLQADHYLEGDVALSLSSLAAALRERTPDRDAVADRADKWEARHKESEKQLRAREQVAMSKSPIDPVWLCAALRETMPDDVIYLDETITHSSLVQRHVLWRDAQAYFYVQGGLGQGLGVALGAKLAQPRRPVVLLVGDGGLLYNPIIQGLGAARAYGLPVLIVVFNNNAYTSMKMNHLRFYPKGAAVQTGTFHGVNLAGSPDFSKFAEEFDGYGERITKPTDLTAALRRGLAAVAGGKTAIVNVILER
jgi:thiamine pyrophosphate-dependent acetolactate synthase large subunit-like protein